jgi:DNA invertase Pin-like site-specific DNA recombinase
MRYLEHMKVGAYLRVSTQDQSTELQRRELQLYLEARGWTSSVEWFEDHGFTGTNTNRPRLKELMAAARARRIDVVLVWKLDRFARSLKDLILGLEELSQLGVAFISLRDQIDLTTAAGRFMTSMLGAFAAFEADLIKERVRAGLANARAKGKRLGRPTQRDDNAILALHSRGKSLRGIARELGTSMGAVQRALRASKSRLKSA